MRVDFLTYSGTIKDYVEAHKKICQGEPFNFDVKSALIRHIFMLNIDLYLYRLIYIG